MNDHILESLREEKQTLEGLLEVAASQIKVSHDALQAVWRWIG